MILRVQSAEGTSRVDAQPTDVTSRLYELVHETLNLRSYAFALYQDRNKQQEVISSKSITLRDLGMKHGDMLYLSPVNGATIFPETHEDEVTERAEEPTVRPSTSTSSMPTVKPSSSSSSIHNAPLASSKVSSNLPQVPPVPNEDEVDLLLYQQDGRIQRQRDEKLCRHNTYSSCVHCSPIEAWDEGYLKEHNIKHMSFHSYLRKTMQSGKFIPLEEPSFEIKPGCREHPPWPRGLCSRCAPGGATLARQTWRHVDNVQLQSAALVERFLHYWRSSGEQRAAILLGDYAPTADLPLGIRARVSAIYEPAQISSRDHIQLLEDPLEKSLETLSAALGLRPVGWIFTDLLPLDLAQGTVQHIRGVDSHFLSAWECITAGHLQNKHPNVCRFARTHTFGSKFVTVCVTGDKDNQIHLEGYQVSNQCAALVRENLLLPTKDAPELFYVRDTSTQNYSFDIYYKERDSYGNEVSVCARRVPVAYVLVDVPVGVSRDYTGTPTPAVTPTPAETPTPTPAETPTPTLHHANTHFPPAHRDHPRHQQTLQRLMEHCNDADNFLEAMSDIHVLLYLMTNSHVPMDLETLRPLIDAVNDKDLDAAERWRSSCGGWATLCALAEESPQHHDNSVGGGGVGGGGGGGGGGGVWTCAFCTFHNAGGSVCDMCALPRENAM